MSDRIIQKFDVLGPTYFFTLNWMRSFRWNISQVCDEWMRTKPPAEARKSESEVFLVQWLATTYTFHKWIGEAGQAMVCK